MTTKSSDYEHKDLAQAVADLGMCLCRVRAGEKNPPPCARCQARRELAGSAGESWSDGSGCE